MDSSNRSLQIGKYYLFKNVPTKYLGNQGFKELFMGKNNKQFFLSRNDLSRNPPILISLDEFNLISTDSKPDSVNTANTNEPELVALGGRKRRRRTKRYRTSKRYRRTRNKKY